MEIRNATLADQSAILDIINYHIEHTTAIFDFDKRDIETQNSIFKTKTKKGFVLHPPKKPRVWHVGKNISEQIKLVNDYQNGNHKSPIAHIRKAHWHGVRTGRRGSIEEKLHYKWWPATLINGKKAA